MVIPTASDRVRFHELLCNRFSLVQEATGLNKTDFGRRIGLSTSQVGNITRYRNPPSHETIYHVMQEFGVSADWFYTGARGTVSFELAQRLHAAEIELGLRAA